jgi:acylphosphatase
MSPFEKAVTVVALGQHVAFPPGSFEWLRASREPRPRESEAYNSSFAMIVAKRFFVSGRVQGVGFRYFVQDHAAVEGVHGYVRNLPDGRVEAFIEGDEDSVVRVERALRRGPPGAQIDNVVVEAAVPSGRATGFSIR